MYIYIIYFYLTAFILRLNLDCDSHCDFTDNSIHAQSQWLILISSSQWQQEAGKFLNEAELWTYYQ